VWESKNSLEYSTDLAATKFSVVGTATKNTKERPVRPQDDTLPELKSPTGGLEQQTELASSDLDRIMSDLPNGFATFDRQWQYTYVNNRLLEIFNLSRAEVLGKKAWEVFPHRVGIEFFDLLNRAMTERIEAQFEFYYDGEGWVEHRVYPTADGLAILMADISDRKQAEFLLLEQRQLLELVASGVPMAECLAAVCASVSKLSTDVRACILLTDSQQQTFKDCIAPMFPPSWCQGLWGAVINELAIGTCGTAVYCDRSVTCADIASDDSWSQPWRDICLAHGVLACHSTPILNADDVPLGSLMLCFDTAREPTAWEYQLAHFGTHIASIVFERDQSSLALRESAAEYRNLFESIDEGFCIVEMMFDAQEQPVDYRFEQANPALVRLTGLPADVLGKTAYELVPDLEQFWVETYGKVALTGEPVRFENKSEPMNRWFDVYASRVGDAASRRVAIIFNNITERKQAEQISQRAAKFDAFRITLADALRPLADPVAIQATASRVLGEYLGANRVAYFELRDDNYFIERDYINGVAPLSGNYPIDSFGAKLLTAFHSGRAAIESDVAADLSLSPAERDTYTAIQIGAYIAIPLIKGGKFVAGLAVHSSAPRDWTPDEVALVEEVAERTWAALERARAEAALCQSEAKYRTLFESMDEGYVLMDLISDAEDRPMDLYYLEANPAAVRMMGTDPVGLRASEIFALESHWMETLGRIAQTGIGERQELYATQLDTWYNFYVFKIGDADSRRVAFIYDDVTERKRRETNLAFLTEIQDEFARLVSADEIMQTVGVKIGAYLNVAHCLFSDIDETQEQAVVAYDWHTSDTPSLIGVYQLSDFVSEEFQRAARARETIVIYNTQTDARLNADEHAAFNVHAAVTVPCHCGNEWKYLLTVNDTRSRDWREDEIELLSELANRIFPRIERARAEAAVAANLRDTRLLRDLSARLVPEDDIETLYRDILATAINLTGADAGTMQILDDQSEDLLLISSHGFDQQMTEHFYRVNASSHTPCGIALRNGERTFVDFDVPEGEDPDGSMRLHLEAGYRSAQSTLLISRTGKPLGIVSTHWRSRHRQNDRELQSLDLLARQVADLIEQRQTTAALLTSEEQSRTILESITDAFIALDENWRYTYVNFTAEELLFRPPGYLVGKNLWEEFPGLIGSKFEQLYRRVAEEGVADSATLFYPDHNRWYEVRVYPVANGITIYCSNVTHRKQMETELEERNLELDRFVHIISHDLKAPLRGIANLSQWIEEEITESLSEETRQQMELLRNRVHRMEAMINGLLDYARAGRTDGMIETVDVEELLAEVIDSIAPPLTFEIAIAPGMPTLQTKRLLLSQVFSNLISNGVKHHPRPDGSIRISSQDLGDFYEFKIADDGPGIAPEYHDKIFMIFQTINPQKNADSSGVGLCIVKKIVETEEGTIRLESKVGEGTAFYFTWPKAS
jgi:PAS domain S-box-containing protein